MDELLKITEAGVARIEAALGLRLPDGYRRALLDDPFGGGIGPFLGDAQEIVAANGHRAAVPDDPLALPPRWLVVGASEVGDQYVIDAELADPPVWAVSYETWDGRESSRQEAAPSVAAFVACLRRVLASERLLAAEGYGGWLGALISPDGQKMLLAVGRLRPTPRDLERAGAATFQRFCGRVALASQLLGGDSAVRLWRDESADMAGTLVQAPYDRDAGQVRRQLLPALGLGAADVLWWIEEA